ncbi:MAG: type II secretion system GspH family protein [Campylobacter sp.]|uniref:type II secretion system protein n=1 Tax=Campylobacter sp. TaxID=205 RepID=UPI002AA71318|nr:type II secretion system protein [Campylobacter sp.]MCI6344031.1 type II secretion system GspH family protein [Campylobacter sp.]
MKKGFTMIELIFVIVILGILASVAIPRLAATREDAEISAAVANLRTLVSDINSYYVAKGTFTDAKWNQITNVPLQKDTNGAAMDSTTAVTAKAYLKVGNVKDCIDVQIGGKNTGSTDTNTNNKQTHIKIAKKNGATGTCDQVLKSDPLKPYFNNNGEIAIGSSTSVY